MKVFADEIIDCVAATVKTLTSATYAPPNSTTVSTRATLSNISTTGADSAVLVRFISNPTTGPSVGRRLLVNESMTLESFEDIQNCKLLLEGAVAARIHVAYHR